MLERQTLERCSLVEEAERWSVAHVLKRQTLERCSRGRHHSKYGQSQSDFTIELSAALVTCSLVANFRSSCMRETGMGSLLVANFCSSCMRETGLGSLLSRVLSLGCRRFFRLLGV